MARMQEDIMGRPWALRQLASPGAIGRRGRPPSSCRRALQVLPLVVLTACAPALDWREVQPPNTNLKVMLPCRPSVTTRNVQLAGRPVKLAMHACKAGELTWAVSHADVGEPALVAPALRALAEGTVANVQGQVVSSRPAAVRGATPHEGQAAVQVVGRRPDGVATRGRFIVFSHGLQVFQAIVMGAEIQDAAAETFLDSLRFAP
jgi:hypothetical protein